MSPFRILVLLVHTVSSILGAKKKIGQVLKKKEKNTARSNNCPRCRQFRDRHIENPSLEPKPPPPRPNRCIPSHPSSSDSKPSPPGRTDDASFHKVSRLRFRRITPLLCRECQDSPSLLLQPSCTSQSPVIATIFLSSAWMNRMLTAQARHPPRGAVRNIRRPRQDRSRCHRNSSSRCSRK